MAGLYPHIEPNESGLIDVGDNNHVYWKACGNPRGKAAVVLHGGPGSGCTPWHRRLFDPAVYRVVLFDQRGCGRSRPHASDRESDLEHNTTSKLISDVEQLRLHLGIDRWLVLGGSWGSTLALAYAESHPAHVSEMILFGITTGRRCEFDWTFRGGLGAFFPAEWNALLGHLSGSDQGIDVAEAFHSLLMDADPKVSRRAAETWCLWESATSGWPPTSGLAERFTEPAYALAFARIVTHYVRHNAWLEDGVLLENAVRLTDIPGTLINGRFDFQAPLTNAWELRRAWPRSVLEVVNDAGHAAANAGITQAIVQATDRYR